MKSDEPHNSDIREPTGDPFRPHWFGVASEPPESGWWQIYVVADDRAFHISGTNTADPVPALITLLESVSAGTPARVLIDEEGVETEITAVPRSNGQLRLVLVRDGPHAESLDLVFDAREVVRRWYRAILSLAADRALFGREWACSLPDDYLAKPPFNSRVIEAFLEGGVDEADARAKAILAKAGTRVTPRTEDRLED